MPSNKPNKPTTMGYRIGGYYIIWIEGLNYKTGDKIEQIGPKFEELPDGMRPQICYTTYMTKALRVKGSQIPEVESVLKKCGIAEEFITFIKVNYVPPGTILKDLTKIPRNWV